MKKLLPIIIIVITSSYLLLTPLSAEANTSDTEKKQPIAYSLSKKVNKEIKLCIESGSTNTREFENHKHLELMMPDTFEKCDQGVKSACEVKKSVLLAMEVTLSKG